MSALRIRAVTAAAVAATLGLLPATPASASTDWGINGTYAISSNGEWAKINERYEPQPGERSTWNITTQCTSPTDCAGTVTSDAGWSAPIYTTNGLWYVKRTVENWRYCADGVPVAGLRTYKLYPVAFDARLDPTYATNEFTGENFTIGPSGSCGRNQWPTVRMPFYMKKI